MELNTPPPIISNNGNSATLNDTSAMQQQQQQQQPHQQQQQQQQGSNGLNMRSSYDIDVLRLIGQHLVGMGLRQTANLLLEESGLPGLDHPLATRFQQHILAGEWDQANLLVEELVDLVISTQQQEQQLKQQQQQQQQNHAGTPTISMQSTNSHIVSSSAANGGSGTSAQTTGPLNDGHGNQHTVTPTAMAAASNHTTTNHATSNSNNLDSIRETNIKAMRLAIAEQKFLELVDDNQVIKALKLLRMEVTPLSDDVSRVQHLATLLMCKSNEEARLRANWPGKGPQSRQMLFEKLSEFIPPPILVPPRRLSTLLDQAKQLQREHCLLHIDQESDYQLNVIDLGSAAGNTAAFTLNGSHLAANESNNSIKSMTDGMDSAMDQQTTTNDQCATSNTPLRATNGNAVTDTPQQQAQASSSTSSVAPLGATLTSGGGTSGASSSRTNAPLYYDLKKDHVCSADRFPLTTCQELDNHMTEVWYCSFSNDGTKLATCGLSGKVKIWHVDPHERKLVEKCTLECNSCYSVSCLSWSPNDVYLLACGSEDQPDLWIWNINKEEIHNMISHSEQQQESYTTCSWHLSGEKFAAASIKGNFGIFDLDGNRCATRDGVRVQCLAFLHKDPDYILAADTLNRVKLYGIDDMSLKTGEEEDVLEERHPIMSFTIDKDDKYLAIHLMEQGIHLWDLRSKTLLKVFSGILQRNLTIYSSFSSQCPTFLASGSEDGRVYIYHSQKDQPVAILHGHGRCVNCVSWNPKYPELLVSVSDDRVVRLWGPISGRGASSLQQKANTSSTPMIISPLLNGQAGDSNPTLQC